MQLASVTVEEQFIQKAIKEECPWESLPKRLQVTLSSKEEWHRRLETESAAVLLVSLILSFCGLLPLFGHIYLLSYYLLKSDFLFDSWLKALILTPLLLWDGIAHWLRLLSCSWNFYGCFYDQCSKKLMNFDLLYWACFFFVLGDCHFFILQYFSVPLSKFFLFLVVYFKKKNYLEYTVSRHITQSTAWDFSFHLLVPMKYFNEKTWFSTTHYYDSFSQCLCPTSFS